LFKGYSTGCNSVALPHRKALRVSDEDNLRSKPAAASCEKTSGAGHIKILLAVTPSLYALLRFLRKAA
jgi:hypothetical protein